jgi:hypothetical protein
VVSVGHERYFVIGLGNCINAEAIFTYRPCRCGAAVVATVPEDDMLLTIISRRKWRLLGWIFVIECKHSNFIEMVDQHKRNCSRYSIITGRPVLKT